MAERFNSLDYIIGVEEAGRLWDLSPGTIKNYCSEGRLIAKKIGKTWIIDRNQANPKTGMTDRNQSNSKRRLEMELIQITSQYNSILSSPLSIYEKDKAYAALMTEMEIQFSIPLIRNVAYEEKYPDIIKLYHLISMSRKSL